MRAAAALITLILLGCSHDDYLAYRRASTFATFLAAMECASIAVNQTPPPNCQETRHWASMHVAGY